MEYKTPKEYVPLSFCTGCGYDFSGDNMFDKHRIGVHAYTYNEGLKLDPIKEDGRRCMTRDEMLKKGWRPLTDEEMSSSHRDRPRVGFGIEMWFDPAERERLSKSKVFA
jgi:hypothetical protein